MYSVSQKTNIIPIIIVIWSCPINGHEESPKTLEVLYKVVVVYNLWLSKKKRNTYQFIDNCSRVDDNMMIAWDAGICEQKVAFKV